MLSPERLAALGDSFVRLMGAYQVLPAKAHPIFDDLVKRHSEPHRHYHTLEHVAEVLKVVGRLSKYATDPNAVQLAAWFHDAVYDPKAKDNELKSADLAVWTLETALAWPIEVMPKVAGLIMDTTHRSSDTQSVDPDTAVLLDADLAILAAEGKRYTRYAADIRKEYAWVPEADYRKGRVAVLNSFLARPRIYLTPTMFDVGEEIARQNLRGEIERLQQAV